MTSGVEIALLAVIVVIQLLQFRDHKWLRDRLVDRQVAADKHAKANAHELQRARVAADLAVTEARHMLENGQLQQQRLDQALRDPRFR